MSNYPTCCVIEKTLPLGKVLVALASRRANLFNSVPKKTPLLLLSQGKEFAAADRAAIEAYKAELLASLATQNTIAEPACRLVGNGKRKNSAHLTNPM